MANYLIGPQPKGVNNNRKQVEYQYFPSEYFTGADVTIYFGDTWVDEITSLQFQLIETVEPIVGYASYTADEYARGTREVKGAFTVAYKEAGYLYTILDHIAQHGGDQAKPTLAYLAMGETVPKWQSPIKTRIEDALAYWHGPPTYETKMQEPDWPTLKYGDRNNHVKELQTALFNEKGYKWSSRTYNWSTLKKEYGANNKALSSSSKVRTSVKELQTRLNEYPYLVSPKLVVDGKFGIKTEAAVKKFQQYTGLSVTGIVDSKVQTILERGTSVDGIFMEITRLAVCLIQQQNGITPTGVVGSKTRALFKKEVKVKVTEGDNKPNLLAEPRFTQMEREIWGRRSLDDKLQASYRNRTYFYQGPNASGLKKKGFDIYITYGPINEDVKARNEKWPDVVNYNTTVRAIRNVQLNMVQQILNADGIPIEEIYSFVATDLD